MSSMRKNKEVKPGTLIFSAAFGRVMFVRFCSEIRVLVFGSDFVFFLHSFGSEGAKRLKVELF